MERRARSPLWGWAARDPASPWRLSLQGGARTLAMAPAVLHQIVPLLAPGWVPLFLSAGYPPYRTAILTHVGHGTQPPRRQVSGPAPPPRWRPLPALLSAQVVKTRRRRRLVEVPHRVVCGPQAALDQVLAPWGWQSNTACVERLTRSLRQRGAAIGRRSATPGKSENGLGQQLARFQVSHNFVLPACQLTPALVG